MFDSTRLLQLVFCWNLELRYFNTAPIYNSRWSFSGLARTFKNAPNLETFQARLVQLLCDVTIAKRATLLSANQQNLWIERWSITSARLLLPLTWTFIIFNSGALLGQKYPRLNWNWGCAFTVGQVNSSSPKRKEKTTMKRGLFFI